MHEMSIAMQVIESVQSVAAEHDLARVEEVHLDVGEMRQIVPEAMQTAFEVIAEGTVAQGATLTLREVPLRGTCRACGHRYKPEIANYLCPECCRAAVEITEGNEILLRSVVGDRAEGASTDEG